MTSSPSIARRAVLAIVLMIGFYLLALAIALGLLFIPYAEVVYADRLHFKLAAFCVIGALAIVWSVLPRFDKFDAPGPSLTPAQQPLLFDQLEGIAASTHQAMPSEVYLVPDVNAWVTQRGGIMGFGSRRVMGLGLPLMRVLTCSQFRAVLAHEFGHYHAGDTKLGPWIYKTRGAIGRTLGSLGEGSLLQLPFLWYGKMFLRITHAVSRRQEFFADELAARAVGSQPLIGGLRTIHGVAPAFNAYWFNECVPVLNAGFRPPLTEGFQQFVQAGKVAEAIGKQLDEEIKTGKADPYDTHPPLKERIEAVADLPAGDPGQDDSPATTLLTDVQTLEDQLLATLGSPGTAEKLKPIDWAEVCAQVYLPQWKVLVKANAIPLSGLTPEALPQCATDLKGFGKRCSNHAGEQPDDDHAEGLACAVAGAALALALVNKGGKPDAIPGKDVSVTVGSIEFEPFGALRSLAERKLTAEEWQQRCSQLGIQGTDLGNVATGKE